MERFELFFECTLLDEVQSLETLRPSVIKRWGDEIGEKDPSFFPKKGDKLILLKAKNGRHVNSHDSIQSIKKAGIFLPNAFGLIIFEKLVVEGAIVLFQEDIWILGYDELKNLYCKPHFGHLVPYLQIGRDGDFFYQSLPYNMTFEADEFLLAFERSI